MEPTTNSETVTGTGPAVSPSFAAFYAAHHERLFRAVALAIRDVDLASDATDEAMVRAAEHWEQVSAYDSPGGWVYRVALNWSRSVFRSRGRRWKRAPSIVTRDRLPDPDVSDAVARLPRQQRVVVVARYYLDWTLADIAVALDVPVGTVKSRLSRAQDRLAEILEVSRDTS